ncbi:pirin family protein [Ferrovum sp. PN-J185]|uniref:pirin family protein n=1 Tax=Ferrovum sp. PN-J185 TaxID=1356306 RepID=UPI001E533475|nr:pirin family protein [Ferrovum sp. PN-J185]MCC6069243.1 pirin family protein [Ferrovum sp. PN-J185]
MYNIRKSSERGHFNHGWLDTFHSFSFAEYYDPQHMGFSVLRVINEDRVAAGAGFGTHPHRDMEIITIILSGALQHKDSMGNGSIIRPGDVQRMTAGRGVTHSEVNPSSTDPVHLLQIWLLPEQRSLEPSYEQKSFSEESYTNQFALLASHQGSDGSVLIHQDVSLYRAKLSASTELIKPLSSTRKGYLHVIHGAIKVNKTISLTTGDALKISEEASLELIADTDSECIFFDLPN